MSIIPLIATIVTVLLVSALFSLEEGLLFGLIVALVSIQLELRNRFGDLQQQLNRLRKELASLKASAPAEQADEAATAPTDVEPMPAEEGIAAAATASEPPIETEPAEQESAAAAAAPNFPSAEEKLKWQPTPRGKNPVDHLEDLIRAGGNAVVSYFTDGNLFVRIGILVLFFGVAFLFKYAAETDLISLEMRYMAAAVGGLALLVFGWRLRHRNRIYGLLLQGGGIGIIYITIFAAFKLAHLLPPVLTFVLLVFFAAFTVALAVLQDSRALAVFAVLGGFLAPLLASTGSGNYVALFSYYSVLNAAVFAVAWFRAWRALNLLGFIFTFGVFVLWALFDYRDIYLYPALGFLLLFFLMYSLIGVFYAMRQPQHLSGYVDGTLVFGTPLIASSLMMFMLHDYDYGIAGACAGLGLYYILLAGYAWRHIGAEFRLLAEAMLAVGVVFATLAIPYTLDGHWSTAAWALEAAGILWVSIRQQRFYAQCFAIALQVGAGLMFLYRSFDNLGDSAWLNPAFLGGLFVALGALISARIFYLQPREYKLRRLHIPFFIWGMGWWLASALVQIDEYIAHQIIAWLLLFGLTAALLVYLDRLRGWDWMPAAISAALLLPMLIVIAFYALLQSNHVFTSPEVYFWIAALFANYWMISRLESVTWPRAINLAAHTGFVVFVALLLSLELVWLFDYRFDASGEGFRALLAVMPLIAMRLAQAGRLPAITRLGDDLKLAIIGALSVVLFLWCLNINLSNSGDPAPLPYVPFINPVDLAQIAFFLLVFGNLRQLQPSMVVQRDHILIVLAGLIFIWLTAVLMRSMHHFLDIRFDLSYLLADTRVQTAISILWTIIGMAAMRFASRRIMRLLWIIGAGLIGIVLVKMFFIDLRASGTVERIVSFLVVGSLLVATGYFSPIPDKNADTESSEEKSAHA